MTHLPCRWDIERLVKIKGQGRHEYSVVLQRSAEPLCFKSRPDDESAE
jgi:hypothetical protein